MFPKPYTSDRVLVTPIPKLLSHYAISPNKTHLDVGAPAGEIDERKNVLGGDARGDAPHSFSSSRMGRYLGFRV